MKWILYLMLFSTPAANVTDAKEKACLELKTTTKIEKILQCREKFESKRIWSLQTTSQMEFAQFETCLLTQDQLFASSNVASTMTMRSWCFCEDVGNKCPKESDLIDVVNRLRRCESQGEQNCRAEASTKIKTLLSEKTGQNASSIRLYPPQRQ
jgi:hypothetical protein